MGSGTKRRAVLAAVAPTVLGGFGPGCGRFVGADQEETGPSYRWQTEFESGLQYAVGTHDHVIVAGGVSEGRVWALDARTGDPLWKFDAGTHFRSPVVSDGTLLVTDAQARVLHALPAHPESPPPLTTA